ncbi:hypothetical protein YYU_05825 [Anaplasma phagocytophilum str. HZ2]|nr:hypothetical protein YYU_05825 [Anaplasma phagocytophilum str. HZ2]
MLCGNIFLVIGKKVSSKDVRRIALRTKRTCSG